MRVPGACTKQRAVCQAPKRSGGSSSRLKARYASLPIHIEPRQRNRCEKDPEGGRGLVGHGSQMAALPLQRHRFAILVEFAQIGASPPFKRGNYVVILPCTIRMHREESPGYAEIIAESAPIGALVMSILQSPRGTESACPGIGAVTEN
jgi:hypothetical protein